MLAGQILVSVMTGLVAVVATLALSAPLLTTVVAYPAVCSLTLLLTSSVWYIRPVHLGGVDEYFRT